MSFPYEIVPFGMSNRAPVQDLADLHATLLPTSPIALLGPRFMKRFYYHLLPHQGLIFGAIAYVDNKPAGFIVATEDATGFMQVALRHYWLTLVWIVVTSVLMEPKRILAVWEALQIMRNQPPTQGEAGDGEILSLGVLPDYRSPKFIRRSGLRISQDLVNTVLSQFKSVGCPLVRAIVDADNTEAKFFYLNLNWTLNRTQVPGWRTSTVEFVWRP